MRKSYPRKLKTDNTKPPKNNLNLVGELYQNKHLIMKPPQLFLKKERKPGKKTGIAKREGKIKENETEKKGKGEKRREKGKKKKR